MSNGRLTVGISLTNPPYGFTDPNTGRPVGFEVELAKALAEAMELDLTLLNRAAPTLIPAALSRRVDVGAASFTDDTELAPDVCRSASYLDADLAVVVRSTDVSKIKSLDDLAGRKVGVARASAASRWAGRLGDSEVTVLETVDDVFSAVLHGRLDAGVGDRPTAFRTQMAVPRLRAVLKVATGVHYVLVGAAESSVMPQVDNALGALEADGTLHEMKRRWFGRGF